jgi:hypothetical protein
MLLLGSLAYFKCNTSDTYHFIQINRFVHSDNGCFELNGPKQWRSEYTKNVEDQNRLVVKFSHNVGYNQLLFCLYFFNADKSSNFLGNQNIQYFHELFFIKYENTFSSTRENINSNNKEREKEKRQTLAHIQ